MYLKEIEKKDENAVELVSRLIYISNPTSDNPLTLFSPIRKP